MKITDKILMSIDNIWKRKFIFLINTILGIISIVLIGIVLHMYNKTTYANKEINGITELSEDEIYVLSINTINYEEDKSLKNRVIGLLDAINNMDSVKWCGTYVVDTLYFDEKRDGLEEIYNEYNPEGNMYRSLMYLEDYVNKAVNRISMNIEELSTTGVKLPDNIESIAVKKDYIEVLVGDELRDYFKVGEIYTYHQLDESISIKVMGYLPQNSYFYQSDFLASTTGKLSLDGYIIFPEQYKYSTDDYMCNVYFDNVLLYSDDDNIKKEIEAIGQEYNVSVEATSLGKAMDLILEENTDYQNVKLLMIVIFLLTIIAYATSGIVSILIKKNQIGIYYSCGFTTKNIISNVAIENIIQMLVVYCISLYLIYTKFIVENVYIEKELVIEKDIFIRYDAAFILAIVLFVFVIMTVTPSIILKRIQVSRMIGDN